MATKPKIKPKSKFKDWASSHTLHNPRTKLPFRLSVKVHEEIADFIHGSLIGLLLGLVVGLVVLRAILS